MWILTRKIPIMWTDIEIDEKLTGKVMKISGEKLKWEDDLEQMRSDQ